MICTCGKGDDIAAIAHDDSCPVSDWVFGELEGPEPESFKELVAQAAIALREGDDAVLRFLRGETRSSTKGGNMGESVDFNEEEATRGGDELEEVDSVEESGRQQKSVDPDTHANPTELQGGNAGGSDSPGLPGGDSAEA